MGDRGVGMKRGRGRGRGGRGGQGGQAKAIKNLERAATDIQNMLQNSECFCGLTHAVSYL